MQRQAPLKNILTKCCRICARHVQQGFLFLCDCAHAAQIQVKPSPQLNTHKRCCVPDNCADSACATCQPKRCGRARQLLRDSTAAVEQAEHIRPSLSQHSAFSFHRALQDLQHEKQKESPTCSRSALTSSCRGCRASWCRSSCTCDKSNAQKKSWMLRFFKAFQTSTVVPQKLKL